MNNNHGHLCKDFLGGDIKILKETINVITTTTNKTWWVIWKRSSIFSAPKVWNILGRHNHDQMKPQKEDKKVTERTLEMPAKTSSSERPRGCSLGETMLHLGLALWLQRRIWSIWVSKMKLGQRWHGTMAKKCNDHEKEWRGSEEASEKRCYRRGEGSKNYTHWVRFLKNLPAKPLFALSSNRVSTLNSGEDEGKKHRKHGFT